MGIGKAAFWTLEALRSVVFLVMGLLVLGAVERPLTDGKELAPIQMMLLLAANLAVLYVLHRNIFALRRFYRPAEKKKLSAAMTAVLLGFAFVSITIIAVA
ncbi:hypothetical protein J2TS6_34560 [Paenibacillus albilobatus]|uniref:Uncharacterized protein n=1 Tax=Paenibacillus albilobatus TaxID=2716884 RepID=A0A919XKU9_9BACL|nr:hypothetical protein [Paenibacillus albilobatus]GIO32315.1 hypothetical protein J2TS6_34560 [Paenibacillus albilobatus]